MEGTGPMQELLDSTRRACGERDSESQKSSQQREAPLGSECNRERSNKLER